MAFRNALLAFIRLPFLHQPFHFPHLALEEAVDADFAPIGVEGDGGEADWRGLPPIFSKKGHSLFGQENARTGTHQKPFAFFVPKNALL